MSRGLYTMGEISRWLGKRQQELPDLISMDGFPSLPIPAKTKPVDKVPLHSLHAWCKARMKGCEFMTVDQLALEIEMANTGPDEDTVAKLGVLAELTSLADAVRSNLQRGIDPKSARRAMDQVWDEWRNLNGEAAA